MDLKGSIVDTHLKIYPAGNFVSFLKSLENKPDFPVNIQKIIKGPEFTPKQADGDTKIAAIYLNKEDLEVIKNLQETFVPPKGKIEETKSANVSDDTLDSSESDSKNTDTEDSSDSEKEIVEKDGETTEKEDPYLNTSDMVWLHRHLQDKRNNGEKDIPYLLALLEGACIETPENRIIKRNPDLEARCVKLRAQQEAREYRKMTKGVDNVRKNFPEDTISYQLKQVNRQLIAIGQFIISIFAGFLFGFRGVEWMVGNLDFGFRLLLGVMCALVIALAEIYFLAKKLNEELAMTETIQIGGPPKFANPIKNGLNFERDILKQRNALEEDENKEHQD